MGWSSVFSSACWIPTLMSWKYEEFSAWFTSTMLARKTDFQFMLQLMRLAFCPSATQSAKCLSKVPSKEKTNHLRLLRCPSFLLQRGSTWVPSYPLLPPAAIFHDGLSAPHVLPISPSFCGHSNKQCPYGWHWKHCPFRLFSCFSTAKGSSSKCCSSVGFCATSMQRFVILSVSANGHLFHDVLSDMSVNPDHTLDIFCSDHTSKHGLCILPV